MNPIEDLADQARRRSFFSGIAAKYRLKASTSAILLLFVPLLISLPHVNSFSYPASGDIYSDITTTHFPNAVFLLNTLARWHQIPLWSPAILGGYPFFAHPLSGLYYPPGWLALFFPLPFGFNLTVGLHLAWGSIGMYYLMRREGLSRSAALISGLAFGCFPKLFAHYGAGHLTLMYAIPWTPWLLASLIHGNSGARSIRALIFSPGAMLGIILLADIRWGILAWITLWIYGIMLGFSRNKRLQLLSLAKNTALAVVIAAPLLLPLTEYSLLSTRANLTAQESLVYSLPPLRLFGLVFPDLVSNHEWVLYPGAMTIILATLAVMGGKWDRPRKFWLGTVGASLLFSLGAYLPGIRLIFELPGMDLARVPSRALFLSGLGLSALAGIGFDKALKGIEQQYVKSINLALVGLLTLSLGLGAGLFFIGNKLPYGSGWGLLFLSLGGIWIILRTSGILSLRVWIVGVFFLSILEWGILDSSAIFWRVKSEVLAEAGPAAGYLSTKTGLFRIYSPSYSLPQHVAAVRELELADGVDPIQLASYAAFMERAAGVPRKGYSVTIPPYASGHPDTDNKDFVPDPSLLGLLNVRYVVSAFDIRSPSLALEAQFDDTRIYRNLEAAPRAWVQAATEQLHTEISAVEPISWSPNRITLVASGPGKLILSEIAYPGWYVWVDGVPQEIELFNGVLRSVILSEGEHRVSFSFRPLSLYAGIFIWAIFLLGYLKLKIQVRGSRDD
jgi:hypothetical protein